MKKKLMDCLISVCFCLALLLPLIFVNRVSGTRSETENRYLAQFPTIFNEEGHLSEDFQENFQMWLDDNLGFRSDFVALSSWITYHILGKSPSEDVEIGKDGWFFYTQDSNLEIATGEYPDFGEDDLMELCAQQEKIRKKLEEQGIEYILILPPSKVSVYPEMIASSDCGVDKTPVDILADRLEENTSVKVVRLKQALIEAKQLNPVYFKTDTHWNEYGAYIGYKTILNQMNNWGITSASPVPVRFEPDVYRGEFSLMMGNAELLPEEDTLVSVIPEPKAVAAGNAYDTYQNGTVPPLKVVMYGDSMFASWNLPALFAESFSEFTFRWSYDISLAELEELAPDVVLFDIGERYLNTLRAKNSTLTEAPLDAEVLSHTAPALVNHTDAYTIQVTVKNTGADPWTEERQIRLCIWQDGTDWGYRLSLPDGVEVEPGQEYTFVLENFVLPEADQTTLEFQMVQEGVCYFGEREKALIKAG